MTVVEVSLMFYQFVFALFSPLSRGVTVHNIEEVVGTRAVFELGSSD